MTLDKVIEGYLLLRAKKEALAKEQKEAMAPINEKLEKIEGYLMGHFNNTGTNSVACKGIGTAFVETRTDATVQDWGAVLAWIKETGSYEFLEQRVSKSTVKDYLEAHGEVPPGIKISRENVVRVRKG